MGAFGGSSTKTGNPTLLTARKSPPYWGGDRLGASFIPLDGTCNLTLPAGVSDVMVRDFMGGALLEKHDTPIGV